MKTNHAWAFALLLLLPAVTPAAEESAASRESATSAASGPEIELADLIARVAKRTGKQFIIDPRVRQQISLAALDIDRIDYQRLLAILNVFQFAAYPTAGVIVVVPDAAARQMPTAVTTEVAAKTPDDEWVTVLIQGKCVSAAQSVPVLRPMMPQAAHLAATLQTNSLMIVDHAANARRIIDLFERLDKQAVAGKQGCWDAKPGS